MILGLLIALLNIVCLVIGFIIGQNWREIHERIEKMRRDDEAKPPEVLTPKSNTTNPETGTMVLNQKTPQELDQEDTEDIERAAGWR